MNPKLKSAVLFPLILAAGCSSVSMPSISMPWSGSAVKADPGAEALFEEGTRAFNEKKYVRALDSFSKIRTDHPFSPQVTQAELKIAEAYFFNEQYPEAINAFKEFQTLHPTNENIPMVVLRLGEAHFKQVTAIDRDQKNTQIAKDYFENVIANYPKSPQAAAARENLAKCLVYLAEHEFNVAYFYFQQEKYPAARDRFEEIVRKYKDTPTAVKSLFYLGESYKNEKNAIRATLAYEALIQHYPQTKFAADAKTQLAQLEKEKHDPLALLLMRDRRPGALAAPEVKEDPALARLKNLNLIEKKEVVYEEPGPEKGFFTRVADKLNPFSASDSGKKDAKKEESAVELLAKNKATPKEESSGLLSSLWPFGEKSPKGNPSPTSATPSNAKSNALVNQIDDSLKQKGIDPTTHQAALNPPAADLPKADVSPRAQPTTDTAALLSSIDSSLKRSGKNPSEAPVPPEAAEAFRNPAAAQAAITAKAAPSKVSQDVQTSGILGSIDQKLKAQGLEPSKFEEPPTEEQLRAAAATQKTKVNKVELEPKLALEKGPLFLSPAEVPQQGLSAGSPETKNPDGKTDGFDGAKEPPNRVLVKGPVQPLATATAPAKPADGKKPDTTPEDEPKGVFDQIRQDMDNVSKALNPFRW